MNDWVIFSRVLKMGRKGIYRSGTIMVAVVGDTEDRAIEQAKLMVDHFHADEIYPKDSIMITLCEGNQAQKTRT